MQKEMERLKTAHRKQIEDLSEALADEITKADEVRKLQETFHDAERDQLEMQIEALTEELEEKENALESAITEHKQAQFQAQETNKQLISFYVNEIRKVSA